MTFRKHLLTVTTALLFAGNASAQTVSIGTNPQGTLAYAMGAAISKVAIEKADLRMRVVPQGGPTVTLPIVNAGELDFSIANTVVASFAPAGKEMFSKPNKNLRAVAYLVPLYSGFMVRADSDIHRLEDLKGKRVASGYLKQKITEVTARGVLNTADLSYDDFETVVVPNGVRGVEDFEAGDVDATFFSINSGRTKQADAAVDGIRILPVESSESAIEKLRQIAPGATITLQKPSTSLTGLEQEQGVFSAGFVLVTNVAVSDESVYALTKSLYENKDALVTSVGAFSEFVPADMNTFDGMEYHPGAVKFYAEIKH